MKQYFRILSSETFDKRTGAEYISVELPKIYFKGIKNVSLKQVFQSTQGKELNAFLEEEDTVLSLIVKSKYKENAFDGTRTFVQQAYALKVYSERIEGLLFPEALFEVAEIKNPIELQIIKLATEYAKEFLLQRIPKNPIVYLCKEKSIELGPGEQLNIHYRTDDNRIQIDLEFFSLPNGMLRVHETEFCDIEENYCSKNEYWRICDEQEVCQLLKKKAEGYVGYPFQVSYESYAKGNIPIIIKDTIQTKQNKIKISCQEERA